MHYTQYIERNPEVMQGKPIVKGTRLSVEFLLRKLAQGYDMAELLQSYPHLTKEQIIAALEYAADKLANK